MLDAAELARLEGCLARLLPHLDADDVALTGGVAIELHLGGASRRRSVADVDLVAGRLDAVAPSVVGAFLVSHRHVARPGVPKGIVQLVDPLARLRVDVFPGASAGARWAAVGAVPMRVLDARALLAHKLEVLASGAVDEKHHLDALALAALCGAPAPPPPPTGFRASVYSRDLEGRCERCERSRDPRFPLAPRAEVFAVLGYV
jgi:hypothetical protein